MKLPINEAPIDRGFGPIASAQQHLKQGVQSSDWECVIDCAAALAKCALSSNPTQCLINAGMSKCIKCL